MEGRLAPDIPDHSTAQHVRQSRESCKRVRANDCISPEEHVAALSLNHDEQKTAAPSTIQTSEASQQQLKLAQLLSLRGKQQQALELLDAIIIANSADADALCLRGKCFLAQGNHAGVSYCLVCSTVLATAYLPHRHISASLYLAGSHSKLLCITQAFASFAAALAVQPAHAEATVACAAVYRSSGQLLRAVSTLETAVTAAPTDVNVQQAYAAALNALGEQRVAALLSFHLHMCCRRQPQFYNLSDLC